MRDHSLSPAELVARATALATGATPAQSERAVEDAASLLAAETTLRAGVDRALLSHGETLLGALWRNHWRPADAVRVVRRELGAAHLAFAVALVAAEARRYAQAALDRRWTEQLRELEASAWEGSEDAWLDEVARRHRLDRFSALTALLELVRLWSRLPRLTAIGPVPSVDGVRATSTTLTEPVPGEPKPLARIRALLAKAESTDYAEEAEAFTAKAQELMARHSIDEALLAARSGTRTLPGAIRIGIDNPYESAKALLLDAVANANRARSVWDKANGFCTVVGFDADLDAVELLYTSLLVQAITAMNSAKVQQRGRSKAFRQSFLVSYASRIRERLSAATARAERETDAAPSDFLPVLAARQEAVEQHMTTMFPSMKKGRSIRVSDLDGWTQGREAADKAQLHNRGRGELRDKPSPR